MLPNHGKNIRTYQEYNIACVTFMVTCTHLQPHLHGHLHCYGAIRNVTVSTCCVQHILPYYINTGLAVCTQRYPPKPALPSSTDVVSNYLPTIVQYAVLFVLTILALWVPSYFSFYIRACCFVLLVPSYHCYPMLGCTICRIMHSIFSLYAYYPNCRTALSLPLYF